MQTYHDTAKVGIGVGWVLPGLRKQAIVPVDVVWVEAQVALLDVLLDGRLLLILCDVGSDRCGACLQQGHTVATSILAEVSLGISQTKWYMPLSALSGMSCHGDTVVPPACGMVKTIDVSVPHTYSCP